MDANHILESLNEAQQQAIKSDAKQSLILAGAGSGKTRVITHKVAWLSSILDINPMSIMTVTFTNKAAREMRGRIEGILGEQFMEEPSNRLREGGFMAAGVSEELDELRRISQNTKQFLNEMLVREKQRTGIPSLKISFNKVFGYYMEVSNVHKDSVPEDYIRKQTLVNAERYITQELKAFEEKILTAEELSLIHISEPTRHLSI